MSDQEPQAQADITEEEVERFAERLEAWGKDLPPEEQRLLRMMLSSALASAEASADVEGFNLAMFNQPSLQTFSGATLDVLKPLAQPFYDPRVAYPDTWGGEDGG